ncbi:MAG: outer membrane beta-barrel protein [Acidobacteria bacterium]|nr:outer membrane beta-barrel protein [Acidobacteriota bacterium]
MRSAGVLVAVVVLAAAVFPTHAQDQKFEVALGVQYPLVTQNLDIDQDLGQHARLGYRFTQKFTGELLFDRLSTKDDIGRGGDVEMTMYGLGASLVMGGEPTFQIMTVAGLGIGDFTYDNPKREDPDHPNDTDIQYWYEAGGGVQFNTSPHWNFRFQVTLRRVNADQDSLLFSGGRTMIVPALDVAIRF